jgi:hypothetical protein
MILKETVIAELTVIRLRKDMTNFSQDCHRPGRVSNQVSSGTGQGVSAEDRVFGV